MIRSPSGSRYQRSLASLPAVCCMLYQNVPKSGEGAAWEQNYMVLHLHVAMEPAVLVPSHSCAVTFIDAAGINKQLLIASLASATASSSCLLESSTGQLPVMKSSRFFPPTLAPATHNNSLFSSVASSRRHCVCTSPSVSHLIT